ncbi:carbamoyltransferase HypF [Butyrivibrio sp. XBB1001]|uniref:carbamoyltransferase HypF n=1 Tax=Butyrivibrio sp. XBB1001 TaxID=1280682 RepID=UPI000407B9A6|nr:carbamoyltransferase HypF [Butyrivibrio sp. XBB1001]
MISKITVKGAVQGVGYRPFILRKATEYGIRGYVKNIGAAVEILAIGEENVISEFTSDLSREYPAGAFILSVEKNELDNIEYEDLLKVLDLKKDIVESGFCIINSGEIDLTSEIPVFLPDIGICDDCMAEMLDETNRRYRYPLISCASCGPRISILDKLPYDRDTTAMIDFDMCPECAAEYGKGRRRHAQTISCFDCGPQVELKLYGVSDELDSASDTNVQKVIGLDSSIDEAIRLLNDGAVLGFKGVSGFQLICKPTDEAALLLRNIKGREKKPFAVMFSDVEAVSEYCQISDKEKELLVSSARPIVLLTKKKDFPYEVCKDSRYIGAFLPSTGAHRLLCDGCGPLIVTSANKSDEPIITEDKAFDEAFGSTAVKGVLTHKRRINMPQDDSVVFVVKTDSGEEITCFNRRARGYVPLPINTSGIGKRVLAFGGDLKSTFSFGYKDKILTSQYLGDLKDYGVNENLKKLISQYRDIFKFNPEFVVCDMHPLYESVRMATDYCKLQNLPLLQVQHHYAHILSVMAENSLKSAIGISFDGTGFGTDKKVWGGEILYCKGQNFDRKGHLSYVKLCGGDNASKNAKLVKECYHYATGKNDKTTDLVKAALSNNINCFETSSMGRLFDAVCAVLCIKEANSFEGECAIALEKAAWDYLESNESRNYPGGNADLSFDVTEDADGCLLLDQVKLFEDISEAFESGKYTREELAYGFHMAIVSAICKVCARVSQETSEKKICLSGGVFGNRLLLSKTISELDKLGFEVYCNRFVPAGDAGISVGQAYWLSLKEGYICALHFPEK